MKTPKVSIITINYNEPLLERTCESVAQQTCKDYEWIVIDGGSTNPETLTTLAKYRNNAAYFVSEPDKGIYDAMNKGIAQARGDWLIFMNAGDCFYGLDTLSKMIPHLDGAGEHAVVYGGVIMEHREKPVPYFIKQKQLNKNFFLIGTLPHASSFIRQEMFTKYGKYRDDFKVVSDWAKFAQMYWAGEKFQSIGEIVTKCNMDGISSTSTTGSFLEKVQIWKEYQPWVFNEKLLVRRKYLYKFLKALFFCGAPHQYFKSVCNLYKNLLKYTKMYNATYYKNKILLFDHSYHEKTHSTNFMIDLLRDHFDVDIIYDNSWEGEKFFDPRYYELGKYDYIVFLQILPPWKILRQIQHKNMFWFPMEEIGMMRKHHLRRLCKKFKIINFSKIGHERCLELGGESLPVQFFIKPSEFTPGDSQKVFFWQRVINISIRNVLKALPDIQGLSLHLHKAVDPSHPYVAPWADMEKKYQITYSNWLPDKSDLTDLVKKAGIYIAPRHLEGIGMSFLEALAMGKAVIAQDAPTMNEYIENGVNGYLVDFENPEPVDLSAMEWVQKNAYESARLGYARWQNDKKKIIKFIKNVL